MINDRFFEADALVVRDGDAWVAYCPAFDVVSQGDSPEHAIEMVREATGLVLEDCLNNGTEPYRESPDLDVKARLLDVQTNGRPLGVAELDQLAAAGEISAVALHLRWAFVLEVLAAPISMTATIGGRMPARRANTVAATTADARVAGV